ncbi:glycoside hydrolase [Pseudomassariella vexata]|uniref:alpha-1,2-Mannosidase n=1 Tax=Pseudomassariella vexata TaxID=1141098 RepID=A0A1Y2EJN6_9PEZI|nr:glycoside hydrolase [Pseudomassariella vexata]ORY71768.1 glycoside hydrolase [Pseudomassariella vexata]
MGVRRVRILITVVALYILGSWYYKWGPPDVLPPLAPDGQLQASQQSSSSNVVRWKKLPTRYPAETLAKLPRQDHKVNIPRVQAPNPQEDPVAKSLRLQRLAAVKESFVHSWEGYKANAWLRDEVMPITGSAKDPFGGWSATLVDALDTLWIMGMKDDFDMAVKACDQIDFATTATRDINVFETTIRYLGGFLAAYELSEKKYSTLLKKAVEVGELLICAFDTPNRMPISRWNWKSYVRGDSQKAPYSVLVSEIGSLSLEFSKLSQLTGDLRWHDAAQRISDEMEQGQSKTYLPGMWPVVIDASKTPIAFNGDTFTLGGMSDSLYEYFPKQYLLLGGMLEQPRRLYEGFIDVAKQHMFRRALNPDNLPLLFSGDVRIASPRDAGKVVTTPRAQHLTCFAGGMVGLAAKIFERPADMEVAIQLTDGCVWAYNSTPSGIGPEIFTFIPCDPDEEKDDCKWSEERWIDAAREHWRPHQKDRPDASEEQIRGIIEKRRLPLGMTEVNDRKYILRPEAIESVFLMRRMTGDASWMDKAWAMFEAVEKHTRTKVAAASLDDVTMESPYQVDSMESFWLAETLKYFYLVFSDWDVVDLDTWVLNTEAHAFRRADAA